jgi:hypothetical protein
VTESEWATCQYPRTMLAFLRDAGLATNRKLRWFALACFRRVWHLIAEEEVRNALEVSESFTDGLATEQELFRFWEKLASRNASEEAEKTLSHFLGALVALLESLGDGNDEVCTEPVLVASRIETAAHPDLIRCIFGPLPFRRPAIDPSLLAWNSGAVQRLAEAVYQERALPEGTLDAARLGVLADALEDAGCQDQEILGHLRGPGPHLRGCWCVDLLTGRE